VGLAALVLLTLLAACGGSSATAPIVIVTATPTQGPVVLVVTATPSPAPQAVATDTPVPPPASPTIGADQIATAQAILTQSAPPATDTPIPTDTPVPPPPTAVPTRRPAPTATKPAQALPPPVLMSPAPEFSCFNISGCNFTWSWGQTLADNQYFQVQLVGPGNEHRGIHPPTKQYSFQSSWSVYQIIRDWCDPNKMCHMQWTVAIIEWDGKDPSKIGRTLIEAEKRWVWL